MFGSIGHDVKLGDVGLREGKASHVTTQAFIDDNGLGIGEALILNTPVGQILNTVLRAGCNLYVSSRADGLFNGTYNGLPVVDEDAYELEGWDFVIEPGFLRANPKISEALNDLQKNVIMKQYQTATKTVER